MMPVVRGYLPSIPSSFVSFSKLNCSWTLSCLVRGAEPSPSFSLLRRKKASIKDRNNWKKTQVSLLVELLFPGESAM
jgi:hypothetical protein